jgi:hypothetical protein
MSVRLFDMPHRKKSTVTIVNNAICPTGNTGIPLVSDLVAGLVEDTCIVSDSVGVEVSAKVTERSTYYQHYRKNALSR